MRDQPSLTKSLLFSGNMVQLTKGYGFIMPDAGGPGIFVHISTIQRLSVAGLDENRKFIFELAQDRRSGHCAADMLQTTG